MKDIQDDQPQTQVDEYDPSILPNVLPIYFKRLFPHELFYKWLSYGERKLSQLCTFKSSY